MRDSLITGIAEWAHGLHYEDIPPRVLEKARAQLFSVLGSVYSGSMLEASHSIRRAVTEWDHGTECTVLATGERRSCPGAIYVNSAMSIAHDFDDYLFMGHTGHSAVLVPLALCEKQDLSLREMILAQVVANEVSGRLGASTLLGPLNGQMWTFIHLLGSSCSAGKLLGLEPDEMRQAIGISLYQPQFPSQPGFFGTGSKLLSAAVPSVAGLQAAYLAQKGLTGPVDVLDHPRGFYRVFSYYPLRGMWGGLGKRWVTDTLAIKIYPGCAYLDSAIDALKKIQDRFEHDRSTHLDSRDVDSVVVRTTVLGTEMERLSQEFDTHTLHPVLINFSLRYSMAIVLLTGSLDGAHLTGTYLHENETRIRQLADKISVVPDMGLNRFLVRTLADRAGLDTILSPLSLRDIFSIVHQAARNYHIRTWLQLDNKALRRSIRAGGAGMGRVHIGGIASSIVKMIRNRPHARGKHYDLGTQDLENLVFPFASRVTVQLKDGTTYEEEQQIPRGAPGNLECNQMRLAEEKFVHEATRVLTLNQIEESVSLIRELPPEGTVRQLVALISKKQ